MLTSLSGRVAVGIAVAMLSIALVLFITHGVWFDNPAAAIQRRMDIIGQLIVGVGTAALAVVTWASVYETQQVVLGEDLRFRQSRMPAIVLEDLPQSARTADDKPAFNIHFRNDGEGPAQDVEVSVEGTVQQTWQVQRVRLEAGRPVADPAVPGGTVEADLPTASLHGASYLKPADSGAVGLPLPELKVPESTEDLITQTFAQGWTIRSITIRYKDVFGQQFETAYRTEEGRTFLKTFKLVRPKAYSRGAG